MKNWKRERGLEKHSLHNANFVDPMKVYRLRIGNGGKWISQFTKSKKWYFSHRIASLLRDVARVSEWGQNHVNLSLPVFLARQMNTRKYTLKLKRISNSFTYNRIYTSIVMSMCVRLRPKSISSKPPHYIILKTQLIHVFDYSTTLQKLSDVMIIIIIVYCVPFENVGRVLSWSTTNPINVERREGRQDRQRERAREDRQQKLECTVQFATRATKN